MTLKAEHGVGGAHTRPVVDYLDQGAPGVGNHHVHLGGACIHGILHQLLHYGSGPLHHLSGGNHVGYPGRQYFQASHGLQHLVEFGDKPQHGNYQQQSNYADYSLDLAHVAAAAAVGTVAQ